MGHFQEEQVSQLLQVIAIAHAFIPKGVAIIPYFPDDRQSVAMIVKKSELLISIHLNF